MPNSLPQHEDNDSSQLCLSQDEVARLLNDDAPEVRVDVMCNIADGYEQSVYGERESAIAEQIFRMLVRDTEKSVRFALADRSKTARKFPGI